MLTYERAVKNVNDRLKGIPGNYGLDRIRAAVEQEIRDARQRREDGDYIDCLQGVIGFLEKH